MSQIPAVPGSAFLSSAGPQSQPAASSLVEAVETVFSETGALTRVLAAYEPRDGQRRMAAAVASAIENGGTLLAEAGTGTGKTLAYLVPAILSGRRVLVSTGTKNLQEQVFFKDLPVVQEALGMRITATLMKGRSNYLCLHRWETYRERIDDGASGRLIDTGDRIFLPIVDAWVKETTTGDRAELRDLPEDLPIWKHIAAEVETCLGTECPHYEGCYITGMRRRAAESDVVIVNHHLLCADAAVRQSAYGEVIPVCSTLVVDEAHQLEDVATQYFGCAVSATRIEELIGDTVRALSSDAAQGVLPQQREEILRACTALAEYSRLFFGGLALDPVLRGFADSRIRYTAGTLADCADLGAALGGTLDELEAALVVSPHASPVQGEGADPLAAAASDDATESIAALRRRAGEIAADLRFLLLASDADFVFFVETRSRASRAGDVAAGRSWMALRASPIDVSRIVQDALFDRMRATILTSATLAIEGSFEYVKNRLGIRQAQEVRVASEFDYAKQALLYLPKRVPSPRAPTFAEAAGREVTEIVKRSRGRAFVLFTSYSVLRAVQRLVEMAVPYPILVQGTAPRSELVERFRATPNAVLLATSSFWQGVDVVGEALSCVVIDKLPFASPSDPVTGARIEAIDARGGDAFGDYQVPLAILALQQGLGRLIRHRSDRGVLAILDPRLRTMGYGRRFLASLPPAPVTHDLAAVERFFSVDLPSGR